MQQPAENSFHLIPGPLLFTVPTKDVLRRRAKEYALAWWYFFIWILLAVAVLSIIADLIFGGWSALLKLFAIVHPPAAELLFFLLFAGGVGMYINYSMWKGVDELFQIGAFRKLYRVCPYVDPAQVAYYRLSHLILQRPSRFTYAFSGTKLVVRIHKASVQSPLQSPSVTITMEEREEVADEATAAEQERSIQVGEPIIVESVVVRDSPGTDWEKTREESLSGVQDHESDVTVPERTLSFLVDIHQSVSLMLVSSTSMSSLEDTRKTEVEVPLQGNPHYEALLARLAIRGKEQVERVRLMTDIYGSRIEDKKQMEQSFYDDMRRIREQVKKCAKKSFPDVGSPADQLKLFERGKKTWSLSGSCKVRGGEALSTWYRRIKAMRQGTDTRTLSEDKLVAIASLLLKNYSQKYLEIHEDEEAYVGGYLLQKLHEAPFAAWAPSFFVECRTQFIYTMTFIAECMHRMGVSRQERRYFDTAARYYKECAYAATCSPVDQDQGEKALRSCVEMHMCVQDVESAEGVLRVYTKRMGRIMSGWEPETATRTMVKRYNLIYD